MNFRQLLAAASVLLIPLITGCSTTHGDPNHPKRDPHPVERYEVIATSDAPGPWDSVTGYIGYDVVTTQCTPENKFLGVHVLPQDIGEEITMTRVNATTWKGYFYRDLIQDEDYYGLGTCHWDATSAGSTFVVQGAKFGSGDTLEKLFQDGPQAMYFKKIAFLTHSFQYGGDGTTREDPEVVKHPAVFFPITIAIKESARAR